MIITILVAFDENRLIGSGQSLPWHIAEDLKLFRKRTIRYPVIVGRKTFDAIGFLPGRENIVVTRDPIQRRAEHLFDEPGEHCWYVWDVQEGLELCKMWQDYADEVFIIGGKQIYEMSLNLADRILVSKVRGKYKGDVYFPELDDSWTHRLVEKYDQFDLVEYWRK
jgi:dihydrofolate reductase